VAPSTTSVATICICRSATIWPSAVSAGLTSAPAINTFETSRPTKRNERLCVGKVPLACGATEFFFLFLLLAALTVANLLLLLNQAYREISHPITNPPINCGSFSRKIVGLSAG